MVGVYYLHLLCIVTPKIANYQYMFSMIAFSFKLLNIVTFWGEKL